MHETLRDLGLLILRLTGGLLILRHGWGKLVRLAAGEGTPFIEGVGEMGFPYPPFFAWAAAIAELGGLLIVLGLLTRICAALAAFAMGVAAFLRHHTLEQALAGLGWLEIPPGTLKEWGNPELALLYLCAMLAILCLGPGRWSLDALVFRRRK